MKIIIEMNEIKACLELANKLTKAGNPEAKEITMFSLFDTIFCSKDTSKAVSFHISSEGLVVSIPSEYYVEFMSLYGDILTDLLGMLKKYDKRVESFAEKWL